MFKLNILPSRRVPSGEFTIVTPLADDISGKENMPATHVPLAAKGRTGPKGFIQTAEKKKKLEPKKTKHLAEPSPVSPQAFDKLLVKSNNRGKKHCLLNHIRTTCRYPRT